MVCQVGLTTCKTVCIGKMTRRGRSALAAIIGVRFIKGGSGDVDESVASVNCTVSIGEVNDEPEEVRHDRDAPFCTPRLSLLLFRL